MFENGKEISEKILTRNQATKLFVSCAGQTIKFSSYFCCCHIVPFCTNFSNSSFISKLPKAIIVLNSFSSVFVHTYAEVLPPSPFFGNTNSFKTKKAFKFFYFQKLNLKAIINVLNSFSSGTRFFIIYLFFFGFSCYLFPSAVDCFGTRGQREPII